MNFYQMNSLKIIFFGTPDFSLDTLKYLHNSNHKLISVVTSADKKSGRGLKNQIQSCQKLLHTKPN